MKLTIVAATGGIGRHLLDQALGSGHEVTAVVRNPAKLHRSVDNVAVDLTAPDQSALQRAVGGADAVLSAFGPHTGRGKDCGFTATGTEALVEAMQATDVRRIVVVSAAPVSTTPSPGRPFPPRHDPGEGPVMRFLGTPFARRLLGRHFADLAVMEDLLRESGLDWTVVRPPQLTDRPATGTYRVAVGQNLKGGGRVPRADVAHLMLRAVTDPATVKQALGIAA